MKDLRIFEIIFLVAAAVSECSSFLSAPGAADDEGCQEAAMLPLMAAGNAGPVDVAEQYDADMAVSHYGGKALSPPMAGANGCIAPWGRVLRAIHKPVDAVLSGGNVTAVRRWHKGTQEGVRLGERPTGKRVFVGAGFVDHVDTRTDEGGGADHNPGAGRVLNAANVPFKHHVIEPASGGSDKRYGKAIGDLSGDGMPDVLLSSAAGAGMRWFEYPGWETRVLVAVGSWSEDVQIADMDGDGDPDVINSNSKGVHWYENPLPDGDPRRAGWEEHYVGSDGANVHDLEVGDLDGDGRVDIAVRYEKETNRSVEVFLQGSDGARWRAYAVNETDLKGEGLALGDLDGDGDLDVVLQGTWWKNDGTGSSWTACPYATGLTDQMIVRVADLDGDGRNDILVCPQSSGASEFAWFSATNPFGPWTKHVIRAGVTRMHGMAVADFNGDGHLDLHTSLRHDLSGTDDHVAIWLSDGGGVPTFSEQILAKSGSHFSKVGDIGMDGDLDVVGANWGGDDPLELWENLSDP